MSGQLDEYFLMQAKKKLDEAEVPEPAYWYVPGLGWLETSDPKLAEYLKQKDAEMLEQYEGVL